VETTGNGGSSSNRVCISAVTGEANDAIGVTVGLLVGNGGMDVDVGVAGSVGKGVSVLSGGVVTVLPAGAVIVAVVESSVGRPVRIGDIETDGEGTGVLDGSPGSSVGTGGAGSRVRGATVGSVVTRGLGITDGVGVGMVWFGCSARTGSLPTDPNASTRIRSVASRAEIRTRFLILLPFMIALLRLYGQDPVALPTVGSHVLSKWLLTNPR
jgi:hypothetical protein